MTGMVPADIDVRPPTAEEIVQIYGQAEHLVSVDAHGRLLGWISFREVGDRTWGLFDLLGPASAQQKRAMFYAFRRALHGKRSPVHVAANSEAAGRLLRLLGLVPTAEVYAGKRVWQWIPERSSC